MRDPKITPVPMAHPAIGKKFTARAMILEAFTNKISGYYWMNVKYCHYLKESTSEPSICSWETFQKKV